MHRKGIWICLEGPGETWGRGLSAHLNLAKFLSNSCFSRWKSWMYFIWGHKGTAQVERDISTRERAGRYIPINLAGHPTTPRGTQGLPRPQKSPVERFQPAQGFSSRVSPCSVYPSSPGKGHGRTLCPGLSPDTPEQKLGPPKALPRLWHLQAGRSLLPASPRGCPRVPRPARVAERGMCLKPSIKHGSTQGQSHHPGPSGREGPSDRANRPPPHSSWEPAQEKPGKPYRSDGTKRTPGFSHREPD